MRSGRFCAALAAGLIACSAAGAQLPQAGDPAPEFELEALAGGSLGLADWRGQILVIAFIGYN